MIIHLPFQIKVGVPTVNNRIYGIDFYEKIKQIIDCNRGFVVLGRAPSMTVTIDEIAGNIIGVSKTPGGLITGSVKILDTPSGMILSALSLEDVLMIYTNTFCKVDNDNNVTDIVGIAFGVDIREP